MNLLIICSYNINNTLLVRVEVKTLLLLLFFFFFFFKKENVGYCLGLKFRVFIMEF